MIPSSPCRQKGMRMQRLILEHVPHILVSRQQRAPVERKGVGHLDSMCNLLLTLQCRSTMACFATAS
jgi:hypothetical protein